MTSVSSDPMKFKRLNFHFSFGNENGKMKLDICENERSRKCEESKTPFKFVPEMRQCQRT